MDFERMVEAVREQARACGRLGSPLYAAVLERLADDLAAGGPAGVVLAGDEHDPVDSALPLRLAGSVHRLALSGDAPELAAHYPSCGGDGDAAAAWQAFRDVLARRPDDVRRGLGRPPQTNEVGRAAPLLGALLQVARAHPMPVRLWEIGASAGLNLRADRFAYLAADGGTWGPAASSVVLSPAWTVVPPGAPPALDVVERIGGDLFPVDASTTDGALTLASYVWPDQMQRLERLRAALDVARSHPARVVRARATDLLRRLELTGGALTVVWHSVMWQYLDADERAEVLARIDEIGRQASVGSPFAHIAFEPAGGMFDESYRFRVTTRSWPGGRELVLGEAPPHGLPVTWTTPTAVEDVAAAR